eukprot:Nitzschia sp. Nitz4//scaffold69_size99277//58337//59917//NITZ4_004635-RA/size99277-exonerate_protein2genome-gene-0.66-mRNA-1//1//CDS//3329556721//1314//frame0
MMGRDTPENRRLFPDGPFGFVNVTYDVCSSGHCPHFYHYETEGFSKKRAFHVLIASFRDRFCARTIHNAFSRAKYPHRLNIRIVDQTLPNSTLLDDRGCWQGYCERFNPNCHEIQSQVRIISVDASLSRGPTWARSRLSAMMRWDYLHRNESSLLDFLPVQIDDYCLEIDSHMDFSDYYDERLEAMLYRTKNDYAVLSTYPPHFRHNNQNCTSVPNLCMVAFSEESGTFKNWAMKECRDLRQPKLTNAMWGAGFSFHRCHAELNVPVDPYLDDVFDGEEIGRAMRLFTHGYDTYTPDEVLVTHDYDGHQANKAIDSWRQPCGLPGMQPSGEDTTMLYRWMKHIETGRQYWRTFGTARVNLLLGIGQGSEVSKEATMLRSSLFGLGNQRTLEQSSTFSGIDFAQKRMTANRCGNLKWVPFIENRNSFGVDDTLMRGCYILPQDVLPVSAFAREKIVWSPAQGQDGKIEGCLAPLYTSFSMCLMIGAALCVYGTGRIPLMLRSSPGIRLFGALTILCIMIQWYQILCL